MDLKFDCYFWLIFISILEVIEATMNVTYPEIGTFFLQDFFHPIVRPLDLLPNSPDSIEPTFMLYTRNNPSESDIFYYNPNNILNDHFNPGRFQPNLLTKIIVHGYIDNTMLAQWMHELKDQFLNQASYNVIVVDWQKGNLPPYTQAAANSRIVGAMIGLVIRRLCQDFHLQPDRFHIIGHSLGSHAAGYAGKFLNGELGRITGLDPAGPLFEYHPEKRIRLWHTDAKYVEAIHTDAKQLIPAIGFGMEEPCGHVDFYPNGGINQPGCEQERVLSIITDGLIEGARRLVACNHQRAVDFYIESINNLVALPIAYACESYESFLDGECSDCDDDDENGRGGKSNCAIIGTLSERLMGSKNPLKYQGKRFFMVTAKRSLFFRYQYLIEIKMSRTESREQPIEGFIKMDFIDISGVEESIIFNEKLQEFHQARNYSKVFVLEIEIGRLKAIRFQWSSDEFEMFLPPLTPISIFEEEKIQIDHIKITALSHSRFQLDPIRQIFVAKTKTIPKNTKIEFNSLESFNDQNNLDRKRRRGGRSKRKRIGRSSRLIDS